MSIRNSKPAVMVSEGGVERTASRSEREAVFNDRGIKNAMRVLGIEIKKIVMIPQNQSGLRIAVIRD